MARRSQVEREKAPVLEIPWLSKSQQVASLAAIAKEVPAAVKMATEGWWADARKNRWRTRSVFGSAKSMVEA